MSKDLQRKVAIVTGSANGLGRAIVELFVEHGARVMIADVDRTAGEALSSTLPGVTHFHQTDVSTAGGVQSLIDAAVATFGGLHIMVNNAAVSSDMHARFLDETFDEFDRVLRSHDQLSCADTPTSLNCKVRLQLGIYRYESLVVHWRA